MKYNFTKLLQEGGTTPPPASGVSYNFDTFLNNLPTNEFSRGQTRSSIAWTPNWSDQAGKYENVRALEANDKYLAFTNYVLQNASKDPRVMDYLKLLEQSTTGNGHKAILFNGDLLNSNWQSEYQRLRNDGKYGFYHLGPEGYPEIPTEDTPKEEMPTEDISKEKSVIPNEQLKEDILKKYLIPEKPKPAPWTDWIPLSAQLGNDLMSAEMLANLQKRMRFALKESPFLLHKVTNAYHQRTAMLQNANELRDLAAFRSNSSDMTLNLDNMYRYDTYASENKNQAEQSKADTTFKERGIAENVENTNKLVGADTANYNALQIAAAHNNILDAFAKRDLRRTQALNSFAGNMYTSHGEWLKDTRLNEQAYYRGLHQYKAGLEDQEEFKKYSDLADDFTKSQAFLNFANALKGPTELQIDSDRYNNPDKKDAYLRELWAGDSDLATRYRDSYETEKKEALNRYLLQRQNIANLLGAKNLMFEPRVSNQGIYIPDRYSSESNIHPVFTGYFKKGGKVRARFIDYQNHIQNELQEQRKAQHKRNELSVKKLNADLDRLSREQMILLRSVFK